SYIAEMTVRDEKGGMGKSSQVKFKTDIFTTRTERGLLINISIIKFDYNKADLKTEYKKLVKKVYNFLLQYPDYSIIIEGHSDSLGKAPENQVLSGKRADTVAGYLAELGMERNRIRVYGLGESLPSTELWKKLALNRRVSFILLKTAEDLNIYESFIKQLDLNKEVQMKGEPALLKKRKK
ncbi:MAG: OmpA family protein, partial [bacterium]|nr:OmpA family protein [bacterium]